MNIREFSHNLQKLYQEMSETFGSFQSSTGLHCLTKCGRCCLNPDIEASDLEMIPMALKIYDEGKTEEWLNKLEGASEISCLAYHAESPDKALGKCGIYEGRPAVCRMFGVSGYYNKNHEVTLSICKYIKEANTDLSVKISSSIKEAPMLTHWSARMATLHPELIQNKKPINLALKNALEKVALYMQYQS